MHEGGKILATVIKQAVELVKPGASTEKIDQIARELILKSGGKPSFLNYGGFPASTCISINDEIVHGVPGSRTIKDGDVVTVDIGLLYKGFHTDSAVTVVAGTSSKEKDELVSITRHSLELGIAKACVGNTLGDVGQAIQEYVEGKGLNVVKELVGHGVGKNLHEEPQVLNFGKKGTGEKLNEGMVIAIEPMVVTGDGEILEDGFVFKTKDGGLAAHFEHTVAITKDGPKVLTI